VDDVHILGQAVVECLDEVTVPAVGHHAADHQVGLWCQRDVPRRFVGRGDQAGDVAAHPENVLPPGLVVLGKEVVPGDPFGELGTGRYGPGVDYRDAYTVSEVVRRQPVEPHGTAVPSRRHAGIPAAYAHPGK